MSNSGTLVARAVEFECEGRTHRVSAAGEVIVTAGYVICCIYYLGRLDLTCNV
jgi:hypothetical protein